MKGDSMELASVKGIGPKTEQTLKRMGIENVEDFVTYYPYRYEIIRRSNIQDLNQDDHIVIDGVVETIPTLSFFGHRRNRMAFFIINETTRLQIVIFNRLYLKNKLMIGTEVTVIGKYDKRHNTVVASEIRFGKIIEEKIERIYHLAEGITQKAMSQYIDFALTLPYEVVDHIPVYFQEKYHFLNQKESIEEIHHPHNKKRLQEARKRIIYEELFTYMLKVTDLKMKRKKLPGLVHSFSQEQLEEWIETLPFALTEDQARSVWEIAGDLKSPYQMNRLLQGDVGSGKTVVAMAAIYLNYLSGYQSAFMAPTEILATQHYESVCRMFDNCNIQIALLTGKMKMKERRKTIQELQDGKIDILIGTHALVSDDVQYNCLGLVITDEQHRFGVKTRSGLTEKGVCPDILSMSATPIPRTYALTMYGDMDVSNIVTMPEGRKPVLTIIKREKEITEVLAAMYEQLKLGHQVYVIAPLIEDEENDKNDMQRLFKNMEKAFGKRYQIGVLHGKMKALEKEEVMAKFSRNELQILISTTVIEVGVDVKNATMMVIFDADRFGLATIHQLRGRVGRNALQSYCILISNKPCERLDILVKTNDGFVISEEDFKMRGSGDLFGARQSGDMCFRVADLRRDFKILQVAKRDSEYFLTDPRFSNPRDNQLKETILRVSQYRG